MKLLRTLLLILLGLAILIAILGLFAKKDYHIERSIDIDAPLPVVHEQVRFLKNFHKWSAWSKLDPNMKWSVEGTDGAVGATYAWSGDKKVGKGSQTLTSVEPGEVKMTVNFTEPWESSSPVSIKLAEKDGKIHVSWGFDMRIGFPMNGFAMFTDIDAAIGKDFQKGLDNLKTLCESIVNKEYRGYKVVRSELPLQYYLGVRKSVKMQDIPAFYAGNLPKVMGALMKNKLQPAGPAAGLYWTYDETVGVADMAAAFPIAQDTTLAGFSTIPVGGKKALTIEYYGPYAKTGEAHFAMDDYMAANHLQNVPPVLEVYVTDPMSEPDTTKWLTKVIYIVEPKKDNSSVEAGSGR